ncbi:MAG: hypothetical protein HYZ26_09765 [Chloroflexi bacterium]|nr:hypothetical protein [Chloroflexota bacterium]
MKPGDFTGSLQVREKVRQDSIYSPRLGRFVQPDCISQTSPCRNTSPDFEVHQTWYPDFTYVITYVFEWNEYGELGILVLGNGPFAVECVPYSNCGLPGYEP